ncbi:MAG: HlyD family efflux transporter periplasmic adaptor subunit [Bacteroidales bacterium]|jgi:multidrug efflux pump subunit AcrA (membrane-fusion protein)|nr:HlyD family efflux transporter periplasmic adaptor subunit [Bacteroidales bacterium]
MDKAIDRKPWLQRNLKWIMTGMAVACLLVYLLLTANFGKTLRVETAKLSIASVEEASFLEYLDVEGIVQPISVVKLNAREEGSVKEVLVEEGSAVKTGEVIMLLDNPNLRRQIEEEGAELEKQRINYREKIIEMEQSNINLRKQMLQAKFETGNIRKKFDLDEQEYRMGVMTKARFEIARDEYEYTIARNHLTLQELYNDSITREIRIELLKNDLQRQVTKFENSRERLLQLEVRAPIDGQLSLSQRVEIGEQMARGQNIGELKVITRFKLNSKIGEFYVDRITSGLHAYFMYQNRRYDLHVNRVSPEIKDNKFEADFLFTGEPPENLNLGKSFRVQIELSQPENRIIIPRGTFFQNTGGQWIFKLDPSGRRAYKQYIVLGRQNPAHYEVVEGLMPGDRVIVSGYDYFGDATELKIE